MVPIKIKEFAKKYVETNKDEKLDDVIKRLVLYSLLPKENFVKNIIMVKYS